MMKIFRQGDVLIKEITALPKKLTKQKDKVVAWGEVTGHSHRFESSNVAVFLSPQGQKFLEVLAPSPIVHEEHGEITILPGKYEVFIEREWDYTEEQLKTVVD